MAPSRLKRSFLSKRNPIARQLKHFTSKVFKNKKRYDRKKLETKNFRD